MRITIAHNKSKQEVVDSIDRGFDDVFKMQGLPLKVELEQKNWQGLDVDLCSEREDGLHEFADQGNDRRHR